VKPLLAQALPIALEITGARAALVVRDTGGDPQVIARAGEEVELAPVDRTATTHPLPGECDTFVLVGGADGPPRRVAVALLEAVAARALAEQRLDELVERVDCAQQLANMGDYDWNIGADTNRWSDQLYRIYGHEPGAFEANYDAFLAHIHPDDRDKVRAVHQRAYATGEPYEMVERIVRPDGTLRVLASNGRVIMGANGTPERMAGTCIDITERVEAEQAREAVSAALSEAEVRRQQAMEMNDNVVQGLTAAVLSMQGGDQAAATRYLERTLAAARHLMTEWVQPLGSRTGDPADIQPGDLIRTGASTLEPPPVPAHPSPHEPIGAELGQAGAWRVLLAEDSPDVRMLLRRQLEKGGACDVVGEAVDGAEAVRLAEQLQPDVVLLDLSMPQMDGLQALPLIRRAAPEARVIVMSGFAEQQMADQVLAAGADRYVEKGLRMNPAGLIQGLLKPA
jgi:PAS domain S-box-containing protein